MGIRNKIMEWVKIMNFGTNMSDFSANDVCVGDVEDYSKHIIFRESCEACEEGIT